MVFIRESFLPAPKEVVRQALLEEIASGEDATKRRHLEAGLAALELFKPDAEADSFNRVAEIVQSNDPENVKQEKVLKLLVGDEARMRRGALAGRARAAGLVLFVAALAAAIGVIAYRWLAP